MTVLKFTNFYNELVILRDATLEEIEQALNLYPTAVLKIYDFQTGEIITFINDDFKWKELNPVKCPRLCEFR